MSEINFDLDFEYNDDKCFVDDPNYSGMNVDVLEVN